jgi:hypothetical protein
MVRDHLTDRTTDNNLTATTASTTGVTTTKVAERLLLQDREMMQQHNHPALHRSDRLLQEMVRGTRQESVVLPATGAVRTDISQEIAWQRETEMVDN